MDTHQQRLEIQRRYRESHREQLKQASREYYERNRDKHNAAVAEWQTKNKEKYLAYQRAHRKETYLANIEAERERSRAHYHDKVKNDPSYVARQRASKERWKLNHPQNQVAARARRKAHKLKNGGSFTPSEWVALCSHYGNKCLACLSVGKKLTPDHVIPLAKGGSNSIDNIQPLCMSCNSRKKDLTVDYRKSMG